MALGEKERLLNEVEKERGVWKQRDRALAAVLQEKETLIHCLKEALESYQKDVQVFFFGFFLPLICKFVNTEWFAKQNVKTAFVTW